jgi:hypothetical protein
MNGDRKDGPKQVGKEEFGDVMVAFCGSMDEIMS